MYSQACLKFLCISTCSDVNVYVIIEKRKAPVLYISWEFIENIGLLVLCSKEGRNNLMYEFVEVLLFSVLTCRYSLLIYIQLRFLSLSLSFTLFLSFFFFPFAPLSPFPLLATLKRVN